MTQFEEGVKLLEEKFGHFKDNVIALPRLLVTRMTREEHSQSSEK